MSYFGGDNDDIYNSSEDEKEKKKDEDDEEEDDDEDEINDLVEEEGEEEMIEGGDGDDIEEEDDEDEDEDVDVDDTEYAGGEGEGEKEEEDEDEDEDEEGDKKPKKTKKIPTKNVYKKPIDYINDNEEDDDEDDDGEEYLQKFDHSINENYVLNHHPETVLHNYDEIDAMTKVTRNSDGIIIDKLHRTIPYLTKYEKARILGQRAKQINSGAYPLVKVPENVIDGLIIAELELKQKIIPFIIRRPLPNGASEYWKVKDLEDISF